MTSPSRWAPWLLPPLALGAVLLAGALVRSGLPFVLEFAAGSLVLLAVGWILVSTLWPARADRRCPRCGDEGLERMDPRSTVGVRCRQCGQADETASAWLLAEEEGPLEEAVLRQRRRRRSAVDRAGGAP